jgi:hypothetical protein
MYEYIFNILMLCFTGWIISHDTPQQFLESVAVIETYCKNHYPFREAIQHPRQ